MNTTTDVLALLRQEVANAADAQHAGHAWRAGAWGDGAWRAVVIDLEAGWGGSDHPLVRVSVDGQPLEPGPQRALIVGFALTPDRGGAQLRAFGRRQLETEAINDALGRGPVTVGATVRVGLGGFLEATDVHVELPPAAPVNSDWLDPAAVRVALESARDAVNVGLAFRESVAIALGMPLEADLIEEVQKLNAENHALRRRLGFQPKIGALGRHRRK